MSLWHADEPDGGANPRGSIPENAHAPVPAPRGALLLLLPLIGPLPASFMATLVASWKSCRMRPAARVARGGSEAARAEREESRRTTMTSSTKRGRARAEEGDAIIRAGRGEETASGGGVCESNGVDEIVRPLPASLIGTGFDF